MKFKIEISRRDALHIRSPHTFEDCCYEADNVLRAVQKEIDKIMPERSKRMTKAEKGFFKKLKLGQKKHLAVQNKKGLGE